MGDLKARIRARFSRSNSATPSVASSVHSTRRKSPSSSQRAPSTGHTDHNGQDSFADGLAPLTDDGGLLPPPEESASSLERTANGAAKGNQAPLEASAATDDSNANAVSAVVTPTRSGGPELLRASSDMSGNDQRKLSAIHEDPSPPPPPPPPLPSTDERSSAHITDPPKPTDTYAHTNTVADASPDFSSPTPTPRPTGLQLPSSNLATPTASRASSSTPHPVTLPRRQNILSTRQSTLVQTLLGGSQAEGLDAAAAAEQLLPLAAAMVIRKVWVRRPGASATLVTIHEDDVVDDVRDMILRKYANSLGRQFDSPDLTLRVKPREQVERTLNPEEPIGRILDVYFPGGQTVDEALVVDVPLRRTPRASPRAGPPHAPHLTTYFTEDARPSEVGTDYFGPAAMTAAHVPLTVTAASTGSGHGHAIAVLTTGQVPQLPSPGSTRSRQYRDRPDRPRLGRQHTSSPTIVHMAPSAHVPNIAAPAAQVDQAALPPAAPPLPTPPAPEATVAHRTGTPPPQRVSSPRPTAQRAKKSKKTVEHPSLPAGSLAAGVPPINVLIVEDNIINLKLLEAFMKRLKVRWQSAMNGRDAVTRWRTGGFHLVLMDIQLPVMSGLDATREIRRLERVNSIGVFSSSASSAPEETKGDTADTDVLPNVDMFRSPVIIVALTASSLQSDRHEALAAGCNDFLTKPVNFVWLERKVTEWGCMQALIDFDGWRKWKDFSQGRDNNEGGGEGGGAKKAAANKGKKIKSRPSASVAAA